MILLIDNYDSFVFNLVQYLGELGEEPQVVRNDRVSAAAVRERAPDAIVISPGPGRPEDAGVSVAVIRELSDEIPILGVCLGHQAIAVALGGRVVRAARVVHGRATDVQHDGRSIFAGLPSPLRAGRYHSLVIDPQGLPAELEVSGRTEDGLIMAVRHRTRPLEGVQFHPESVLTPQGRGLLSNFLAAARAFAEERRAGGAQETTAVH